MALSNRGPIPAFKCLYLRRFVIFGYKRIPKRDPQILQQQQQRLAHGAAEDPQAKGGP